MASVDNGGFNLEDDISAKIGGYRKEYESGRDRGDYGYCFVKLKSVDSTPTMKLLKYGKIGYVLKLL